MPNYKDWSYTNAKSIKMQISLYLMNRFDVILNTSMFLPSAGLDGNYGRIYEQYCKFKSEL